jgi:hypothetical protein
MGSDKTFKDGTTLMDRNMTAPGLPSLMLANMLPLMKTMIFRDSMALKARPTTAPGMRSMMPANLMARSLRMIDTPYGSQHYLL